jgi:hypothetical protein
MEGRGGLGQGMELPFALRSHVDESHAAERGEMPGHLRLRLSEDRAEVTDTELLLLVKQVQDPQAGRVREGTKEVRGCHIRFIEYDEEAATGQGALYSDSDLNAQGRDHG